MANLCIVLTVFNECARTKAPKEYESFVANVTHALSEKKFKIYIIISNKYIQIIFN